MIDQLASRASVPADSPEMAAVMAMAAPAVLLLANAMLILSTIQRLQAILARIRENEEAGREAPASELDGIHELLGLHGRRARMAHRALLGFYASTGTFLVMIAALGAAGMGVHGAMQAAFFAAFTGGFLLLVGTTFLMAETWIGVRATDLRVRQAIRGCERRSPE